MARLKQYYQEEIVPRIKEKFAFTNTMRVPRVEKVVVNMGIGAGISDAKAVQAAADDLALIVGQKPVVTRARKSIAGFNSGRGCRSVAG